MAKKGIKIKDLSRELGVTSRVLIQRCRDNGLTVQNSVTKLAPHIERDVRGWFSQSGSDQPESLADKST